MNIDFRRNPPALPPLTIMDSTVATVESFRFLGTNISQDLKWDNHIDSILPKQTSEDYSGQSGLLRGLLVSLYLTSTIFTPPDPHLGPTCHCWLGILAGYIDIGNIKYLCFIVLILLFVAIIIANQLIIGIIWKEKSLHEPMYVLLCSLSVNELYGSIALFPSLLSNMLLSKIPEVSLTLCYAQIFVLYTYASVEFCNLAVMSYDRYVAICYPLEYHRIMSPAKTVTLIALGWSASLIKFSISFSFSVRLKLCGNVIDKVWCDNYMLVKLVCSDTTVNNISVLIGTVVTIVAPLALILFSYAKILRVCLKSTRETTKKALSTCTSHIFSLLNFSVGCSFEMIQSRFNKVSMPPVLRVIVSLYFLICTPLINPIMYGMRLSKIKSALKKLIYPWNHMKPYDNSL
ncbi:olfactory receptor 4B13-like [Garra rufa]|uniref:olfactory receptor 4B13-like n=1 Tax=Garra rufa TaxID=137080 RepID=UPI003CCEAB78